MYEISNPLSANSYTNKDFQSIYVELLETAKKLAHKWDPTISNESDPGVVLLKLDAIIGDKNNYNIDKNVLENYPETFTQERSARSQYRQLGYKMPWYQAASTEISFRWVGKTLEEGQTITIPKYTMLTDTDNTTVYTTTQECVLGKLDGVTLQDSVPALQGILTQLKISGSTVVTLSNIDRNNRLYINDRRIAENGIFVYNVDNSMSLWEQVDNVELQPSGSLCYEFNIDPMNEVPYLQFADDIRDTIGYGLGVKYLVTNGYDGNVAANTIVNFYEESQIDIMANGAVVESVPLGADSVNTYNLSGTTNGADPETIEKAYRSFKKRVATFDTLVTLRDYVNALYNCGYISNAVVSDRTTDIQSSYKIYDKREASLVDCITHYVDSENTISFAKKTETNSFDQNETLYIWDSNERTMTPTSYSSVDTFKEALLSGTNIYYEVTKSVKKMNAFDLKFYMLKDGGLLSNWDDYNRTFELDDSSVTKTKVLAYIEDSKSVQHDVQDIDPYIPFMIQNVYPIKLKIVPAYKLKDPEMQQVETNVWKALVNILNSRECDFGTEPNYDIIYNAIADCDERIKVIIMDDLVFTSFAQYLDIDEKGTRIFKSVPISEFTNCERIIARSGKNAYDMLVNELNTLLRRYETDSSETKKSMELKAENYLFVDETEGKIYTYVKDADGKYELKLYSDQLKAIRKQIMVKNILAGVTPLFDDKSKFKVSLGTNEIPSMTTDVEKITTSLELYPFGKDADFDSARKSATYTLRENENLRFLAPSFINDATYSNYVKFELVLANPTSFTTNYVNADPAESTELFARYGSNQFYEKTVDNHFAVVKSTGYEALKGVRPEFKLDSYLGRNVQLGNVVGGTVLTDDCSEPLVINLGTTSATTTKVKEAIIDYFNKTKYAPKFEKNLFYAKVSPSSGNASASSSGMCTFVLTESYPSDWKKGNEEDGYEGSNYKLHYRLKQYQNGPISMRLLHPANYVPTQPAEVLSSFYAKCDAPSDNDEWTQELFYGEAVVEYVSYAPANDLTDAQLTTWYNNWKSNWTNYYYLMPKAAGDDSNSFDCIAPLKADGSHFKYPNKAMYGKLYKIENEKYVDVDASSISDSDWNKESGAWKNYYYATNASADEPAYEALWDADHSCFNYLAVPGGVFEKTETTEYRKIYRFEDVEAYANADNLYRIDYSVVEGGVPASEWNNNWQNYYGYGNKCEYMPDAECFEVVGDWMSHLYTPSAIVEGKAVGFKMVNKVKEISIKSTDYTVTTVNGENIVTVTKYVKDKVPTNWDKDYSRYLVRTCSYEDGKIEGVVLNSLNTVCPDFKAGEVFSATASAGMFEDIGGSSSVPENWETTYTNYYSSTGLQVGLLENSYEMQQWKAGSLKLYVPEMSFTVPANTEYQLKSGDYLSFFWREQDNDDAPYNYVKYDDVYDKETGAPTIIKASFTINASPISECLINPQKLTSATGKIYTNDTLFNILKEKFYGEYDLSGTKKIEMRKMNAVKMNNKDNKYFYFIIRDKDEEEDTQSDENQYKLVLNRVGVRNNNYVKYTYTLENDEYFIYTNSSKTGFEALGAGTLIEYYEYFDREIPTDEKKVFYAPIIDAQKIAYSGIDAFVDSCDEVRGKNTFSLVEQQIYSFTNGDSVHIQLNDDYDYSFVEVENPDRDADLGQNNFYIDGSEFCKVELLTDADTNTKAPPPYIKDYYYIGTSDANGTFYTLIESLPICAPVFRSGTYYATDDGSSTPESEIPDGWETVYKNYFVMNNHKYTRVEGVSCWNKEYFEQNDIYIKSGYNFELITDKQTYQEYVDNGTPIYEKQAPNYPQYNGTPSPVYNYSVSYATNNSSGETNASSGFEMLPQILVTNEDYCWRASSHLNLSSAENKPQKIENATGNSVQSVKIGGVNFPENDTYTNEEGKTVYRFDKNNPLYLVTEINIDKVGGSDVDVSWVDMMNNRHPIDVFVYQLNPAFNNSNGWSYLDDGTIRLIAKGDGTTTTKVIEGIHLDREFKYILPITLYANDDTTKNSYLAPTISVVATLDNGTTTTLECVCHKHTSLKPDTHFVLLPSNAVTLTVTVNGGSGKEDVSAKFGYLFKYVHREMFDGGGKYSKSKYDVTTDELIEELRRLDVPKVFDYTHMPDKSICIDDPLSAYSFFEPRHVFNSVTIPRAELRFTNQMGTEVPFDSSITFVNNR